MHKAQLLAAAAGVINCDRQRPPSPQWRVPPARGRTVRSFRLVLVATGELPHPPQRAFLRALVNRAPPPALSTTPTDHLEGRGLGRRSRANWPEIGKQRKQRSGVPGAAVATGWRGNKRGPRSINAWLVSEPQRIDQTSLQLKGVLRAGGRGWAVKRQLPFDVAIQDR